MMIVACDPPLAGLGPREGGEPHASDAARRGRLSWTEMAWNDEEENVEDEDCGQVLDGDGRRCGDPNDRRDGGKKAVESWEGGLIERKKKSRLVGSGARGENASRVGHVDMLDAVRQATPGCVDGRGCGESGGEGGEGGHDGGGEGGREGMITQGMRTRRRREEGGWRMEDGGWGREGEGGGVGLGEVPEYFV